MSLELDFPHCECFDQYRTPDGRVPPGFHADVQDTRCDGWKRLVDLVEEAAKDGRPEFCPFLDIPREMWPSVITLPDTIAKLKSVRRLNVYGMWLVRIPAAIGAMANLEEFVPYTAHCLHWFPYEITRCTQLKRSTVSTRSLYGNYKYRPPFPRLRPPTPANDLDLARLSPADWGIDAATTCSVCDRPLTGCSLHQVWLSSRVATDVLPLLVTACSEFCLRKLPQGAEGYVQTPHRGGAEVLQPPPDR